MKATALPSGIEELNRPGKSHILTGTDLSIAPSRASSARLKASGCRSQALYLFVSRFNFFVDLIDLRVLRIVTAQLIQQFADGEFIYFGHVTSSAPWSGLLENHLDRYSSNHF
jgi:hypothetical protein